MPKECQPQLWSTRLEVWTDGVLRLKPPRGALLAVHRRTCSFVSLVRCGRGCLCSSDQAHRWSSFSNCQAQCRASLPTLGRYHGTLYRSRRKGSACCSCLRMADPLLLWKDDWPSARPSERQRLRALSTFSSLRLQARQEPSALRQSSTQTSWRWWGLRSRLTRLATCTSSPCVAEVATPWESSGLSSLGRSRFALREYSTPWLHPSSGYQTSVLL